MATKRAKNAGRRGKAPARGQVSTQAELAAALGVSLRMAQNYLAEGMRDSCQDPATGCYALAPAFEWRVRNRRFPKDWLPAAKPATVEPIDAEGRDLEDLRKEHEAVKIELSQHKLALARGDVIPRDEIESDWSARASRVRDDLRTAADTLPPRVLGEPESKVREILREAFRVICNRYADR